MEDEGELAPAAARAALARGGADGRAHARVRPRRRAGRGRPELLTEADGTVVYPAESLVRVPCDHLAEKRPSVQRGDRVLAWAAGGPAHIQHEGFVHQVEGGALVILFSKGFKGKLPLPTRLQMRFAVDRLAMRPDAPCRRRHAAFGCVARAARAHHRRRRRRRRRDRRRRVGARRRERAQRLSALRRRAAAAAHARRRAVPALRAVRDGEDAHPRRIREAAHRRRARRRRRRARRRRRRARQGRQGGRQGKAAGEGGEWRRQGRRRGAARAARFAC